MQHIDTILTFAVYLLACFALFFIGKLAYSAVNRSINMKEELVEKDNFAFSVAQLGYYIGLLLSIGGAILGPSNGLVYDLIDIGVYGALSIVLLNLSLLINDKLILYAFSVRKEIVEDQNAGTGVVAGASAAGTGLIILGAVYGEGGGIDTALVFWAISQVILIVSAKIYTAITPYNVHDLIEKDNVAAGISFAGVLIAISNLIRNATMVDFVSWTDSCIEIGIEVGVGLAFLPVARFLTDRILLPGSSLTHEISRQEKPNSGAALIEAFAYIGGSVLITWCL